MLSDKQILLKIIEIIHDCGPEQARTILWNDQEHKDNSFFNSDGDFTEYGKNSFVLYTKIISEIKAMSTQYQSYKKMLGI